MKIADTLSVTYRGMAVGRLTMTPDGRRCAFQYDKAWLSGGFSISPLYLPLKDELFIAGETPFVGNFGIFDDSIPVGFHIFRSPDVLKSLTRSVRL